MDWKSDKFQLVDMFPRTQKPVDMFLEPKVRTGRTVDMFLTAIMRTGKGNEYLNRSLVPHRDYSVATKVELVEILYFKHFYEHFTVGETDWSKRGKRLEKYVRVAIAIELVTVGTKLEDL